MVRARVGHVRSIIISAKSDGIKPPNNRTRKDYEILNDTNYLTYKHINKND